MDKLCFYDGYREIAEETISFFEAPNLQQKLAIAQGLDALRDLLQVDPAYLYHAQEVPAGMKYLKDQLGQTNPYILSHPVVQMALDMVEKAGDTSIPYEPFLKLPFWIEFEGVAVGDEQIQFVAIWAFREQDNPEEMQVQLIAPGLQQAKTLFFDINTGVWEYEQMGACENKACQVALYTKEGMPFRLTQKDSLDWKGQGCICALAGLYWAQIVNAVNHLLRHRKDPITHSFNLRHAPLPYSNPKTRKEKVANSLVRKRNRQDVVTLSLSAPVQVHQRAPGGKRPLDTGMFEGEGLDIEKREVEGYWKMLIPGEGKPWKSLQIIQVEGYSRKQIPSPSGTRYRVVE